MVRGGQLEITIQNLVANTLEHTVVKLAFDTFFTRFPAAQ